MVLLMATWSFLLPSELDIFENLCWKGRKQSYKGNGVGLSPQDSPVLLKLPVALA